MRTLTVRIMAATALFVAAFNLSLVPTTSAQSTLSFVKMQYKNVPRLKLSGDKGVYEVQYTDLLNGEGTNWIPLRPFKMTMDWSYVDDASASNKPLRFYRAFNIATPSRFAWIPSGYFTMGSPITEQGCSANETQHQVILTKGFFMGKYEVTQGEYLDLTGTNPSYFTGDTNRPVEMVTWLEASNYCVLLTARESAEGRLPPGWKYRLPTESEWEYACRAKTTTPFHYTNGLFIGMANFDTYYQYSTATGYVITNGSRVGYLGRTTAVGSYATNGFGLYDMHGNVNEFCYDGKDYYPLGSVTNPIGPVNVIQRVIRGGSWGFPDQGAIDCRSANRNSLEIYLRKNNIGFRVVLSQGDP